MLGILGGTGFYRFSGMQVTRRQVVRTPYGLPSSSFTVGRIRECEEVVFLARHGQGHTLAPHLINYRANLWALRQLGVTQVVAVATVGAIADDLAPGMLVLPDQIIDYTWGRASTYLDSTERPVVHVDMTQPYSEELRTRLRQAATANAVAVRDGGTYGCTQGPRLETAAEIRRLRGDGCDMVGMTAMPEAALARELGLSYAALCVVSNYAAGCGDSQERIDFVGVRPAVDAAMRQVQAVLSTQCELARGGACAVPG